MKVYLVYCNWYNGEDYEDAYSDNDVLCIKSTEELAINYIRNLKPTEKFDDEENDEKWGIISDEFLKDGKQREVHIGRMRPIYADYHNTIDYPAIGYEDLFIDGQSNYGDEWYLTYEVREYEVEES